jgi:Type I phosphodiesterase / nucleotide pyrophosphatase
LSGIHPPKVSVAAVPIANVSLSDVDPAGWVTGPLVGADGTGADVHAFSISMSPATVAVVIRSGIAERVWQARNVSLPQPVPDIPYLADVVPSVVAAMGVAGFDDRIGLPGDLAGACVLLVDGLGAELLDTYADDAPVMAELRGRTLQAGFPSTTAAGLASVGTGCRSGEHGLVGYSFRLPDAGVINALRWRPHPWGDDLRDEVPPEQVQPIATIFERAASAGVAVSVVSGAEFTRSGLTRAALRGGRYVGVQALGDLAAAVQGAVADGGFCYGYHSELDLIGHLYGPGSAAWRMQLRQVDRLVESVVDGLPAGGLLAVVADHGMVAVEDKDVFDVDDCESMLDGVQAIGGEPRARHVYVADGALETVLATWREVLADRAWVISRDEAIAAGWFGERVRDEVWPRIGDVVAAARGSAALVRRNVEPLESSLIGHHGSLTDAEQRIPLLLARA